MEHVSQVQTPVKIYIPQMFLSRTKFTDVILFPVPIIMKLFRHNLRANCVNGQNLNGYLPIFG
jgi:hypothetical protein